MKFGAFKMAETSIPKHIKADVQKLAYDRAVESINRICDTFGTTSDFLALASSASMSASFMMLYCAARIKHGPEIAPAKLLEIWADANKKEMELMIAGFDAAQEYTKRHGHA